MLLPVTFFSHSSTDFSNLSMQLLQGIPEDQVTPIFVEMEEN